MRHTLALVARTVVEYVPGRHPAQLGESKFTLYLPASQSVQPTPTTYLPATQAVLQTLAPAREVCPAGQTRQLSMWSLPATSLYLPATQFVQ
jgi:hypothetical protein